MNTTTKVRRTYDWNDNTKRTAHATTWDNQLERVDIDLNGKRYALFNTDDLDFMINVFTQLKAQMEQVAGMNPHNTDGNFDTSSSPDAAILWYIRRKKDHPYWTIRDEKGEVLIKFVHDPQKANPEKALESAIQLTCPPGQRYWITLRNIKLEDAPERFLLDLS